MVKTVAKKRERVRTECGIRLRTFIKSDGAADCAVCLDTVARKSDPDWGQGGG